MKKLSILTIAAFLLAILVSFTRSSYITKPAVVNYSATIKYRTAIPCSPTAWLLTDSSMPTVPALTGWGNYSWKLGTKSDSARFYFNQGINMYYGFHIIESLASFQKSAQFDPGFALAYWGQALAYGPNINDAGYYIENPKAWPAIQKAVSLLNNNSNAKEKALINAQVKHFSPDSTAIRGNLNKAYAAEMKSLSQQFADDPDVASLYVDALMNLHPWDLYDHSGNPQAWTPEITRLLEKILKKYPSHPAAIHYYIHAVEASNDPGRALPYADKLGSLMPDVAHMVHMPSHIYIRTGMYEKGIRSNEEAVKAFGKYVSLFPPSEGNAPLYFMHNVDMQAMSALMAGHYNDASTLSVSLQESLKTVMPMMEIPGGLGVYVQFLYAQPYLNLVRFGKWDEILATPAVDEKYTHANALWHFARGMAFVHKADATNANLELLAVNQKIADPLMKERYGPFNSGEGAAMVASKILEGEITLLQGDKIEGIKDLELAVDLEMALNYNEPADWRIPARHYLGAALLKKGDAAGAQKVYLADLNLNPGNIWSIKGLELSLAAQKKTAAAANVEKKFKELSEKADTDINSSAF